MNSIYEWIQDRIGLSPDFQQQVLITVVLLVVLWGVRRLVMKVVAKRTDSVKTHYQWKKGTLYVAVVIGILMVSRTWLSGFGTKR